MSVWKIRKSGKWISKFKHLNRQYKKEGFKTRSSASAWEVAKKEELNHPEVQGETPLTFAEASTLYLEDCKKRFQLNTVRQKAFVFRMFIGFIGCDPSIEQLARAIFTDYLKNRSDKEGNKAANRDLREFNALYNWLKRNEIDVQNPCRNISKYPEEQFIKYVPPSEDVKRVLLAAEPDDMDLLLVVYHTSGRIGEILKLTWDDVNFERRAIRLFTRKRKGGGRQADQLSMNPNLFEILKRRWKVRIKDSPYVFTHPKHGGPLLYDNKRYLMSELCEKAGVRYFGFHAIRHHVASILWDSGKATMSSIQMQMRHRRPTTTDNYLHTLDPEPQLKFVAGLIDDPLKTDEESGKGTPRGTIPFDNKKARPM